MGRASRKKKSPPGKIKSAQGEISEALVHDSEPRIKKDLTKTPLNTSLLSLSAVLLVSIAVYFNALYNGFVFDDNFQIVMNPWIKNAKYLPDIFSKSVWSFLADPTLPTTTNYYRPLMYVIYMLDYYVFGLSPWGFHMVNMLFHTGNTAIVFWIAGRLLTETATSTLAFRSMLPSAFLAPAFIAALIFAVHPIHTEAVTWIASLPEVSFTFFFLLSFYCYMCSSDYGPNRKLIHALSIASFFLAALCKETALTLPFVLIAYERLIKKSQDTFLSVIKKYAPYIVVSTIYMVARYHALSHFVLSDFYPGLNTYQLVINIFPLFTEYLTSMIWPVKLNLWHSFHPISSLSETKGILSAAVTLAFITASVYTYKKSKSMFFGLLLTVLPLLPVFYIKAIGGNPFAERYLYLPSFGFVILIAILYSRSVRRMPQYDLAIVVALVLLVGLCSLQTISRNKTWKNDLLLFTDTVEKSPDAEEPNGWLGFALMKNGSDDDAIEQFKKTLALNPNAVRCHRYLGSLYLKKGLPGEAIKHLSNFLSADPNDLEARRELADAYMKAGMADQADVQRRITEKPDQDMAAKYVNKGTELAQKGMIDEAIAQYEKALSIDPNCVDAHYNLGSAYANSGRLDKAIEQFTVSVRLRPQFAFYHDSLGRAYKLNGSYDRAIEEFKTAMRLDPHEDSYRKNLDAVLALKDSVSNSRYGSNAQKAR